MERKIELTGSGNLSEITFYDHHTLTSFTSIIFEIDNEYYFICEESEKLEDVSQMPDYIKKDWIKYNKKDISVSEINKHIGDLGKTIDTLNDFHNFAHKAKNLDSKILETEDLINNLKSIRRDLIIKGLAN